MIEVPNWNEFQQYKDREPKWIKLHRGLLDSPQWGRLTGDEAKLLIEIWLLAARCGNDGKIDKTVDELAWMLRRKPQDVEKSLSALCDNNFLTRVQNCTDLYENVPREEKRREEKDMSKPDEPVIDLWDVFLEELGGSGKQPRLTDKRKQKLRALYDEQLKSEDQPTEAFRRILRAVKKSEHHMGNRSYQMPESLFRDESRRDGWMQKSLQNGSTNGQNWVMLNGRMVSVR